MESIWALTQGQYEVALSSASVHVVLPMNSDGVNGREVKREM